MYAILFGIVFLAGAVVIYKAGIEGRPASQLFRVIPIHNFFAVYVIAGVLNGYAAGILAALARRPKELLEALGAFFHPTIERVLAQAPGAENEDLQRILDSEDGGNFLERMAVGAMRKSAPDLSRERILEALGQHLRAHIVSLQQVNVVLGTALLISPLALLLVFR